MLTALGPRVTVPPQGSPAWQAGLGSLGFHSDIAGDTMKDDAVLSLNNLKACWDQICFYVPRKVVGLRKLGLAGLSTVWAHKIFSPVLTHRRNMRPESGIFQPGTVPQFKLIQRRSGRRTYDRWRPGWSRYFSGKKLIAGRLDLKPGIVQSLNDDLGRVYGIQHLGREVAAAEKVDEHVLGSELAHGLLRSPCQRASYSFSRLISISARWNTAKLKVRSSFFAPDIRFAAISPIRTQSR